MKAAKSRRHPWTEPETSKTKKPTKQASKRTEAKIIPFKPRKPDATVAKAKPVGGAPATDPKLQKQQMEQIRHSIQQKIHRDPHMANKAATIVNRWVSHKGVRGK